MTDRIPTHRATYCPEDNKLRFYPDWQDGDFDKERMKAAGYRWASKQQCYVCPRWTPTAEDAALVYVDEIEDETYGPLERAADRAERFSRYRDNRREDAHEFADRMGTSPIGFQDAARAERAARKRDRLKGHALTQWDRAEYWHDRTAGVIAHAIGKESPSVRRGRIKQLEAEQRKQLKTLAERAERLAAWAKLAGWPNDEADQLIPIADRPGFLGIAEETNAAGRFAYALANVATLVYLPHPCDALNEYAAGLHGAYHRGLSPYDLLVKDSYASFGPFERLAPRQVARLYLEHIADPSDEEDYGQRWARHFENRLTFERAMLASEGGSADDTEIIPGGFILLYGEMGRWCLESSPCGWTQIERVHKSTATGKATSVEVWGTYGEGATARRALVKVDITRFASDRYRAPTPEELAEFQQKQADAKKAKKAGPKAPTLVNPTQEDAARLMALWNERYRLEVEEYNRRQGYNSLKYQPEELIELTQDQYSARSKGSYTAYDTVYLSSSGKTQKSAGGAVCKIRRCVPSGAVYSRAPYRLVVITDKPAKPLPIQWEEVAAPAPASINSAG